MNKAGIGINNLTGEVVNAAMKVHTVLGPGLLESTYEACLHYELEKRGKQVSVQKALPVKYDAVTLDIGYRIDLLINDLVIVELKAVETVLPIHKAQLLSYLKLSGLQVGLLINFNVVHLKDGITRMIM